MRWIRPLSVAYGMVLDYPGRWAWFGLPMVLNIAAGIGYSLFIRYRTYGSLANQPNDAYYQWRALMYLLPGWLVFGAIWMFLSIVVTRAAIRQMEGSTPTWRSAFPLPISFWPYLGLYLAGVAVVGVGQAWIFTRLDSHTRALLQMSHPLLDVFFVLSGTIVAAESAGPIESILRSVRLVGRRYFYCLWITFALTFLSLTGVVLIGVGLVLTVPMISIGYLALYLEISERHLIKTAAA